LTGTRSSAESAAKRGAGMARRCRKGGDEVCREIIFSGGNPNNFSVQKYFSAITLSVSRGIQIFFGRKNIFYAPGHIFCALVYIFFLNIMLKFPQKK
jgi:hypothetical protein